MKLLTVIALLVSDTAAFAPSLPGHAASRNKLHMSDNDNGDEFNPIGIVAPLTYSGKFPILSLQFEQGVLDFCLATGANINTLNPDKAAGLQVLNTFEDVPVVSTGLGGGYASGEMLDLGDCILPEQQIPFINGLWAATYPTEAADGLLGVPFFLSFRAIEFDWYGTDDDPPTTIFYLQDVDFSHLKRVELTRLNAQVSSLPVNFGAIQVPSVLVTCSPITVMSPDAAEAAGIQVSEEYLLGIDEAPLYRSLEPVSLTTGDVQLGTNYVYVGNLPGVTFLNQLNENVQAVLGLDFLQQTYKTVISMNTNSIYFEELGDRE